MSSKNLDRSTSTVNLSTSISVPMQGVSYDSIKDQVRKIGYLKKLGGKNIKNWRKRFFAITSAGILYYFKHRTSSEPVGAIDLNLYTKIYKDKSKKRHFLLVNENNPNQRVFHLIAETEEELESWINEITIFFEDDISDLKNQLSGIAKQKKEKRYYDTLKRKEITSKKVEEYDLEKLQLVFKGERLSLLVKDKDKENLNNNINNSNNPISPDSNNNSNNSSPTLISINSTITTTLPLNNTLSPPSSSTSTGTSLSNNNTLSPPSSSILVPTSTITTTTTTTTSNVSPKTPRPAPPPRKLVIKNSTSDENLTPIIDGDEDDDSEESN